MNNSWVAALGAVLVALFAAGGAVVVARIGSRSNRDSTAVAFAAQLSTRLTVVEAKQSRMETYLAKVNRWWFWHERWDAEVAEELDKLDPGVLARLPVREEFPLPEPE